MATPYIVKASPGKGSGVFAKHHLAAGTTIIDEPRAMNLRPRGIQITDEQVRKAFEDLDDGDQAKFLKLHEGSRPFRTRLMRIYKANAFGNNSGDQDIFLETSKLNHSCVPNAKVEKREDKGMKVMLIRTLARGDEISINYNPSFLDTATRKQRQAVLKTYWGFDCACKACTMSDPNMAVSDLRRQILNVVSHKLNGREPLSYSITDDLNASTSEQPSNIIGRHLTPLLVPLTLQQKTAYYLIAAELYELENLGGVDVSTMYIGAANALGEQMGQLPDIVVMDAAKNVLAWLEAAVMHINAAMGKDSFEAKTTQNMLENAEQSEQVGTAKMMLDSNGCHTGREVFALQLGEMVGKGLMTTGFSTKEEFMEYLALRRRGRGHEKATKPTPAMVEASKRYTVEIEERQRRGLPPVERFARLHGRD